MILHIIGGVVVTLAAVMILCGLYSLQQNESSAITLFGNYKGTDKKPGLGWVVPWYSRKKISLRVRNVTSQTLKVNDKKGNPIETALREITSHFAYDHGEEAEPTLRADADRVGEMLRAKLNEWVSVAGVTID
jgi:hypothetical protein